MLSGCDVGYRNDLDYSYDVVQTWTVDEIESGELVQFESVDADLIAYTTIRQAIAIDNVAVGRKVLHIGSGTGLIASLCLLYEAKSVLATDIHPIAVSNTRYNVAALAPEGELVSRLRPASQSDAFSAIESDEKFDLIITDLNRDHFVQDSNTGSEREVFLKSFLSGLGSHLRSGGRAIVMSCRKESAESLFEISGELGLQVKSLEADFEDRDWQSLPEPFSPVVLFEVRAKE